MESILRFGIVEILMVEFRTVDRLAVSGKIEPIASLRALDNVEVIDYIHPHGFVGENFHGRFRKMDGDNFLLRLAAARQ